MIETKNLDFSYGDRKALHSLNLKVPAGSLYGLLGPNGGGKTTLFRILSTLVKPIKGTAFINGLDLSVSAAEVRKQLGVVFQHPSLDKKLTARENLIYQGYLYGIHGNELKKIVETRLQEFNLVDRAGDRVETLSGGMQRRLEIAKSLLHRPKILLLDEPSTGLDPGARRDLWNLLQDLKKRWNLTILFTTHILEEAEPCDEVAILHLGKVVAQGAPDKLKKEIQQDSILLKALDPEVFVEKVQKKFNIAAQTVNGFVRIQQTEGHRWMAKLMEEFPNEIEEISLHRPNLNDVFFQKTGEEYK